MKDVWERYKNFIVLVLYACFVCAVFYFVIIPLEDDIRSRKKHAEELTIDREAYEKKIKEIPFLKEKMEVIKKSENELDVFVNPENALPVIESIEKLAEDTGVHVSIDIVEESALKNSNNAKDIKEKDPTSIWTDVPGNEYIKAKLEIESDFNGVYGFISKMEKFRYFSDIVSISISKKQENDGSGATRTDPFNRASGSFDSVVPTAGSGGTGDEADKIAVEANSQLDAVLEIIFYTQK